MLLDYNLADTNARYQLENVAKKEKKKEKREKRKRERSRGTFPGIIGRRFFSRFNVRWQRTNSRERAVKVVSNIHEGNISRAALMVSSGV